MWIMYDVYMYVYVHYLNWQYIIAISGPVTLVLSKTPIIVVFYVQYIMY